MTTTLDPVELSASLDATLFAGKLRYFPTIDSTNLRAMQEAAEGAPHGAVYVADEQTAGRGRGAHVWHSESHAGLYVSLLLRPQMAPADALWLSLAAGLAVQRAVKETTALEADIRWPNDVLLDSRKFCGILTEMNAEVTRVRYAVVGIGINVNHAQFPNDLRTLATSLRIESGRIWSRQDLLTALLHAMDTEIAALLTPDGLAAASRSILDRIAAQSTWIKGKHVHVDEAGGYTGVTAGLDARGFLQVRTSDGLRTVLSGGVRAV
ncbi:MAG TPA: biotin--[acetyl-CoA-carboxylase] ligase [Acidobacteriaceae bacterium]|jgi:BirA family biotin operon repressor/biotin-[acetyl-CoA-carboxylase] ligase|nr:biotin--[acetyl-CoA-carboxylase] ligase [Acidobacteriaceae bacterium]